MFETLFGKNSERSTLIVILMVGIVSAGMGGATFAYFQDADASSANTIQSGTLNVTIDGTDDGVTNSFSITNGQPLSSASKNYTLRNGGSTSADHLQINMSFSENDPTAAYEQEPGDSDLKKELTASATAKYLNVTTLKYHDGTGSTDLLSSLSDGNGNGIVDLADIQNASVMDDLNPPKAQEGNKTYFEISFRVASDAPATKFTGTDEDIMGDGVDVEVRFTLMQDSSQD